MESSRCSSACSYTRDWMNSFASPGSIARREPVDDHVPYGLADDSGILVVGGQGMPVRHEEVAVVLVLEPDPVAQHAVVVTQMQSSGGAHPGEDALVLARDGGGVHVALRRRAGGADLRPHCREPLAAARHPRPDAARRTRAGASPAIIARPRSPGSRRRTASAPMKLLFDFFPVVLFFVVYKMHDDPPPGLHVRHRGDHRRDATIQVLVGVAARAPGREDAHRGARHRRGLRRNHPGPRRPDSS